jgi:hypothetical protein
MVTALASTRAIGRRMNWTDTYTYRASPQPWLRMASLDAGRAHASRRAGARRRARRSRPAAAGISACGSKHRCRRRPDADSARRRRSVVSAATGRQLARPSGQPIASPTMT